MTSRGKRNATPFALRRPPEDDCYVVACEWDDFYVTCAVTERILRELEVPGSPRWIRVTDVNGARVCVRSRLIGYIRECTVAQRASARRFRRARKLEERADRRPWEDD